MQVKRKLMKMYFSSQRTLCSMRSTVIEVHDKSAGIYDNMSVLVENHAHEVLFGLAYEYLSSGYMGSTARKKCSISAGKKGLLWSYAYAI